MIIRISNPDISKNEKTYLSADAAAAVTTLTVQNNEGFSANDYVVIGDMGSEQTELMKISSVSGNTSIVITSALKFAHSIDTTVTFIKYNQYQVYRATSKTGSYSQLNSNLDIEPDQSFSEYDDTTGSSTNWYKFRFYNSTSAALSDYSDPVKGTGYPDDSVKSILDRVYSIGNDPQRKVIPEDEMFIIANDGYRIAISKVMKEDPSFYLKRGYIDVKNTYDTGTVSITDGGTTVTGVSTVWDTAWTGKKILFGQEGYPYEISSVASTTSLTLTVAYNGSGSNLSASSYKIFQDEYDLKADADGSTVTEIRKIERVIDEDGFPVLPFDIHRNETGHYLKRIGDSIKFCVNYIPGTTNVAGRWTIYYSYQPSRLDSMGDTPELPLGSDGVLQSYCLWRLKERMGEDAGGYKAEFKEELNNMVRRGTNRSNKAKHFRLPSRPSQQQTVHDRDWFHDVYGQ